MPTTSWLALWPDFSLAQVLFPLQKSRGGKVQKTQPNTGTFIWKPETLPAGSRHILSSLVGYLMMLWCQGSHYYSPSWEPLLAQWSPPSLALFYIFVYLLQLCLSDWLINMMMCFMETFSFVQDHVLCPYLSCPFCPFPLSPFLYLSFPSPYSSSSPLPSSPSPPYYSSLGSTFFSHM